MLAGRGSRRAAAQDQGIDEIVRDHDRERDAFDDHHRRRRRQAADEGDRARRPPAVGERQRQDHHVLVDLARPEGEEAGERDRHDEELISTR